MGTQQFCLKWNNHHSNMLDVFEQLLSSEALVDVTLACEGLSLKAHKMVLSACSPFFQSLFLENPCKHPIVILKDMRYADLKAIIDFMYRGEVNVSQDQLSALLKTAETLKVKGLAEVTGENRTTGSSQPDTEATSHLSGAGQSQSRSETPPLGSRRKRIRPRRRSLNDANRSDSEEHVPSKIKEPESPEVIDDEGSESESKQRILEPSAAQQNSQSPQKQSSRFSQSDVHMSEEPSSPNEEPEFEVEPARLMEQSMTTDNVPVFAEGPHGLRSGSVSQLALQSTSITVTADPQPHHSGAGPDVLALVPVSMPSESSSTGSLQDTSQDVKPTSLVPYEESSVSPLAGPSHQDGAGGSSGAQSMMFMDSSGVPAIAGPSNYQPEKQPSSQQQQQQQQQMGMQGFAPRKRGRPPLRGIPLRPQDLVCRLCSKVFSNKSNYDGHMMMHSAQRKNYRCDICNKAFLWRNNVYAHKRKIHQIPSSRSPRTLSSSTLSTAENSGSRASGRQGDAASDTTSSSVWLQGSGVLAGTTPSLILLQAASAAWNGNKNESKNDDSPSK